MLGRAGRLGGGFLGRNVHERRQGRRPTGRRGGAGQGLAGELVRAGGDGRRAGDLQDPPGDVACPSQLLDLVERVRHVGFHAEYWTFTRGDGREWTEGGHHHLRRTRCSIGHHVTPISLSHVPLGHVSRIGMRRTLESLHFTAISHVLRAWFRDTRARSARPSSMVPARQASSEGPPAIGLRGETQE